MKKLTLIAALAVSQTAFAGEILGSTPLYAPVAEVDGQLLVETTAGSADATTIADGSDAHDLFEDGWGDIGLSLAPGVLIRDDAGDLRLIVAAADLVSVNIDQNHLTADAIAVNIDQNHLTTDAVAVNIDQNHLTADTIAVNIDQNHYTADAFFDVSELGVSEDSVADVLGVAAEDGWAAITLDENFAADVVSLGAVPVTYGTNEGTTALGGSLNGIF